jgi:hypothetical protein
VSISVSTTWLLIFIACFVSNEDWTQIDGWHAPIVAGPEHPRRRLPAVTGGNEQYAEKPTWWTRPGEQFTKTKQELGPGGGQEIWDKPWFGVNREPDIVVPGLYGYQDPTYSEPQLGTRC